jgi:hypothetical protein
VIGKEVIQNYLLYILKQSQSYDEVIEEFTYIKGKGKLDTPDVLCRKGSCCLLFDSKSSVPKLSLREFDDDSINITIEQYSKNVIQLYERINDFFLYNPFCDADIVKRDIFGIVVLFEDSYVPRRLIYEAVRTRLNLTDDCVEYEFIKSHIKVVDLKEVEDAAFFCYDYTQSMKNQRDDDSKWFDLSFKYRPDEERRSEKLVQPLQEFFDACQELYMDVTHELVEAGIIAK